MRKVRRQTEHRWADLHLDITKDDAGLASWSKKMWTGKGYCADIYDIYQFLYKPVFLWN